MEKKMFCIIDTWVEIEFMANGILQTRKKIEENEKYKLIIIATVTVTATTHNRRYEKCTHRQHIHTSNFIDDVDVEWIYLHLCVTRTEKHIHNIPLSRK